MKTRNLEQEKNLQLRAKRAATRERMARRLDHLEFENVLTFGKRHAKSRALNPHDVENAIADVRANNAAAI